ncbi:MAG: mitochondrial fission ELM1 family protein [Bdellovibrionales bacterium]
MIGQFPTCWVITDGKTGTENQCLGLAEAMGLQPIIKRIQLRMPWRWLTPFLRGGEKYAFSGSGDQLDGPFPDIVIASGRRSLPASFYIKRRSPKTFVVQLQDPHCSAALFDMVVVPEHDRLRGHNVVTTVGALNRVTPEKVRDAVSAQRERFAHLPTPHTAILIGGKSMAYDFTDATMQAIIAQLANIPGSLLITASRRTSDVQMRMLRDFAAENPQRVWLWDGSGDNPYFALLGLGSHIVVTADSVSMISEAAVTGKPIFVIDLPGGSAKFDRFYNGLKDRNIIRTFDGTLADWTYEPIYETQRIARIVKERMQGK